MKPTPLIFRNCVLATMEPRGTDRLGIIRDGALVVDGTRVVWVGPETELLEEYRSELAIDAGGKLITPGLIDCHTHLVFAGDRIADWRKRLEGGSYQAIAQAGGGILSTVRATRLAGGEELYQLAQARLAAAMQEGITTMEIKSGYGLDPSNELKLLQVIGRLAATAPIRILPTLLAAHAIPEEYRGKTDQYVDRVCEEIIPSCAPHCVAVDAFCETIAFDVRQTERVLETALQFGKQIKLHAEQLSLQGGARLAARMGAISADHLEYLDEAGVREMAAAGTTAVLLPGAYYFLRESQAPPVEQMRQHAVPIAIATDFNPGSSPLGSLLLAANMAATLFRMTPVEVLLGITINAARALQMDSQIGSLKPGKAADFVIWNCRDPYELIYGIGYYPGACQIFADGRRIDGMVRGNQ